MGLSGVHRTTVIVPTFNRAHFLEDCLQSLLSQTLPPHEILVIDDGSTDGTQILLRCYPQIKSVHTENQGKSAALNLALTLATGDRIWIVDDDDIACPDALERLTRGLDANPEAGFSYGRHDRFLDPADGGGRIWSDTGYWRDCPPEDFLTANLEDMFAHQSGMLLDKSLMDAVGSFNTHLKRSVDYDFLLRASRLRPGVACEGILFHQRQHAGDRGAGEHQFPAAELAERWICNDQTIFREVYHQWPLNAFLPFGQIVDSPAKKRQALIQRGVVMARKKLWDYAIHDFFDAVSVFNLPLTDTECEIVRRGTQSKYGLRELMYDASLSSRLQDIKRLSKSGSELVNELASGFRWQIRSNAAHGHLRTALRLLRPYIALRFPVLGNSVTTHSPWHNEYQDRPGSLGTLSAPFTYTIPGE